MTEIPSFPLPPDLTPRERGLLHSIYKHGPISKTTAINLHGNKTIGFLIRKNLIKPSQAKVGSYTVDGYALTPAGEHAAIAVKLEATFK